MAKLTVKQRSEINEFLAKNKAAQPINAHLLGLINAYLQAHEMGHFEAVGIQLQPKTTKSMTRKAKTLLDSRGNCPDGYEEVPQVDASGSIKSICVPLK